MLWRLVSSARDEWLSSQGSKGGRVSEHILLHVRNTVQPGRERNAMWIWAKEG